MVWAVPLVAGLASVGGQIATALSDKPDAPAQPKPDYNSFNALISGMKNTQQAYQNYAPSMSYLASMTNQINDTTQQIYKNVPDIVSEAVSKSGQAETGGYGRALYEKLSAQALKEATKQRSEGYGQRAATIEQYKAKGMEKASEIGSDIAKLQYSFLQNNYQADLQWKQAMYQADLNKYYARNAALQNILGMVGNASSAALGGLLYGQNSQIPKTDWNSIASQTVDNPTWNAAANRRG